MMASLHASDYFPITVRESIFIRPMRPTDAGLLFRGVDGSRVTLGNCLPWVAGTTTVDHSLTAIQDAVEEEEKATGLYCGIFNETDPDGGLELVGSVALKEIDRQKRSSNIGYWLAKDHTGSGLCTQACQKLIDYGRAIGIETFRILAEADNVKSQAVARRLGFQKLAGETELVPGFVKDVPVILLVFELSYGEPLSITS